MANTCRWEYLVGDEADRLSEWGQQGWELVSVVPAADGSVKLYLKRPVPSVREQITLEQREQAIGGGGAAHAEGSAGSTVGTPPKGGSAV